MIVSTKGRYALRVMVCFARRYGEGYVPLKEIRAWLRDPKIKAVDISDWSFSQCKELKNNHTLDTICISTGTYGPSGGVFEDEDGTYYVCTRRGSGLTYLAP